MMHGIPLSGTNVRLMTGIPWTRAYEKTRWFGGLSDQRRYFNQAETLHTMPQAKFTGRQDGQHRVAVDEYIENLRRVNYMSFENENGKTFYAFVLDLGYENKGTTWVYFDIDVLQTYMFDFAFKPSFIVREHQQQRNSDGSPVVNTLPEGLEHGNAYDNVHVKHIRPSGAIKWLVIVASGLLHDESKSSKSGDIKPSFIGVPQPLSYYVIPFKDGGVPPVMKVGSSDSAPITPPEQVMKDLYSNEATIGSIVSIYITEATGLDYDYTHASGSGPDIIDFNGTDEIEHVKVSESSFLYLKRVNNFSTETRRVFDDKYHYYGDVGDTKLLMYPYAMTVLDDFKGNRIEIANENINGQALDVILKGSLGVSNKISWGVKNYNYANGTTYNDDHISNEKAIINNDPTDVPVVNDMLAAFMQGNRNSLQQQRSNAKWSGALNAGITAASTALAPMTGGASAIFGTAAIAGGSALSQLQNTQQQLGNIESQKQDADNAPPQLSQMGSNTAYDYGNGYQGLWVIQKQIKPEYRKKLGDFFHMYGTARHEVKEPNTKTREHFNYVETRGCVLQTYMNQTDANLIKQIFDHGVTLWHTDDVGNYHLANEG